jgi:hypothetical protein
MTDHPFDGPALAAADMPRLSGQLAAVYRLMRAGDWWTTPDLARAVGASHTSTSARLRDLRKEKFGGFTVHRRRHPDRAGVHLYRLELPTAPPRPVPLFDAPDLDGGGTHHA